MAGFSPEPASASGGQSQADFKKQLNKVYVWYTGGFFAFVIVLTILEQMGMTRSWIGLTFLLATVGLYAGIGIMSRTSDASEYYVAGRRVPALYNGMATGADWMSAASFIGMAGTLYLTGVLLVIWFLVTFGVAFFARELTFSFFGWPFSFWVGAQGALIVYMVLIWYYARTMNRLDQEHNVAEEI